MIIWQSLCPFDTFFTVLIHFFRFWYHLPIKIWQPCSKIGTHSTPFDQIKLLTKSLNEKQSKLSAEFKMHWCHKTGFCLFKLDSVTRWGEFLRFCLLLSVAIFFKKITHESSSNFGNTLLRWKSFVLDLSKNGFGYMHILWPIFSLKHLVTLTLDQIFEES
jgi:hypothetical protein